MIGLRVVFLVSLCVSALVSGYQAKLDEDAYLESLLRRFLDLQDRKAAETLSVDNLVAKRILGGYEVDNEVITEYNAMKLQQTYSWIICKMVDSNRVVIDSKEKGSYDDFVAALKKSGEPRFAVYDPPADWPRYLKIIFIYWLPSDTSFGMRMQYSSAKDNVKKVFAGISGEVVIKDQKESIKEKILETYA